MASLNGALSAPSHPDPDQNVLLSAKRKREDSMEGQRQINGTDEHTRENIRDLLDVLKA